jgi:hypothetical protein
MPNVEFREWDKIPRISPFKVTVTEKINGTNSCIIIADGKIVGTQSRKRLITPENDNFGFASWVKEHEEELKALGDGYHYGEWAGPGIQTNPHGLEKKTLYLFNTFRWNPNNPNRPECCDTVPVLFEGELEPGKIQELLDDLKETADTNETPEGVVVYYHAFRKYTKHTIASPNGKWCKD